MIVGLTQIRGVGYMFANTILNVLKINPNQRMGYLSQEQIKSIEGIIKNPSITNFDKFIDSTIPFIPEIKKAEHMGSMFTTRVVPPHVEDTDERPTMVRTVNEQIITVFSGKITTCVDAANDINKLITSNH